MTSLIIKLSSASPTLLLFLNYLHYFLIPLQHHNLQNFSLHLLIVPLLPLSFFTIYLLSFVPLFFSISSLNHSYSSCFLSLSSLLSSAIPSFSYVLFLSLISSPFPSITSSTHTSFPPYVLSLPISLPDTPSSRPPPILSAVTSISFSSAINSSLLLCSPSFPSSGASLV